MAIEIVDFPIKNGDFHSYVSLPEDKPPFSYGFPIKTSIFPYGFPMVSTCYEQRGISNRSPSQVEASQLVHSSKRQSTGSSQS